MEFPLYIKNENDDPTRDDGVWIILHGNKKTKKIKKN
jgi:hypothetical protein